MLLPSLPASRRAARVAPLLPSVIRAAVVPTTSIAPARRALPRLARLAGTVLASALLAAPAALGAQAPAGLTPADSALVARLMTQYKAAADAKDAPEAMRLAVRIGTVTKNGALLHKVGHFFESGSPDLPKDDAEAVRVFTLAAELGDAESQHHIAMRLFEGRGLARDSSRGARLMQLSARQGYDPARDELRKLRVQEERASEAASAAKRCAVDEIKRLGWMSLTDAGDIFRNRERYVRIPQKAPSLAELRGDVVTVEGPGYNDRSSRFSLEVEGFVGLTEKSIEGSTMKMRSLDRIGAASAEGAAQIERVRATCAPR